MEQFNLGDPVTMTHYVKAMVVSGRQIYVVVKHKHPLNGYWMGYRDIGGPEGNTHLFHDGAEDVFQDRVRVQLVVTSPRYNPNKALPCHVRAGHHGV